MNYFLRERDQTNLPSNRLNILTKTLEKGREGPPSCWCSFGDEERTLGRSKHLHSGGRQGYQERLARIGIHKKSGPICWWYFIWKKKIRITWQEKVEAATLACSKHPSWVTDEHPPSDDMMSCLLFLFCTNRLRSIREGLTFAINGGEGVSGAIKFFFSSFFLSRILRWLPKHVLHVVLA